MSTCGTWPDCIGSGRFCNSACPPALAGTDKTDMSTEEQDAAEAAARRGKVEGTFSVEIEYKRSHDSNVTYSFMAEDIFALSDECAIVEAAFMAASEFTFGPAKLVVVRAEITKRFLH